MNKPFVQRKKIVLFIDTGDNCRAPMAKGYLEKLMKVRGMRHVQVGTAGVMTRNGLLPTQESVQMLSEEGEDIRSHRSKPMTFEMLENADLVLGMGAFQVQKATRTNPNAKGKTFLLKEFVGLTGRNAQISDPMGGTMEVYRKVFNELKAAINLLIEKEIFTSPPPEMLALAQPAKQGKALKLTGPEGKATDSDAATAKSGKAEKTPATKAKAEKPSAPKAKPAPAAKAAPAPKEAKPAAKAKAPEKKVAAAPAAKKAVPAKPAAKAAKPASKAAPAKAVKAAAKPAAKAKAAPAKAKAAPAKAKATPAKAKSKAKK